MVSDKAALLKLYCKYENELLLRASHWIRVSVYTCTYYISCTLYVYIWAFTDEGERMIYHKDECKQPYFSTRLSQDHNYALQCQNKAVLYVFTDWFNYVSTTYSLRINNPLVTVLCNALWHKYGTVSTANKNNIVCIPCWEVQCQPTP